MEIKGSAYKKIAEILMEARRMSGSARAYKLRRAEQKKAQRELANRQRTQAAGQRLDAIGRRKKVTAPQIEPEASLEDDERQDREAEKEDRADDMQKNTNDPKVQQSLDAEWRHKERARRDQGFEEFKKKSVSPEEVRGLGGSEEEASKYKGPWVDPKYGTQFDDPGPGRYPVKREDPSKPTDTTGRAKDWLFSRSTAPFTAESPSLMQRFLGGHNPNHPDNLERQERLQAKMKTRHSARQHKVPDPAPNWQYAAMRKIPGLRTLGRAGEKFIRRSLHTAQPWRREKGVFDKPYKLQARRRLGNLRKFLGGRTRATERSINDSYGKLVVEIQKRYQNHYNKKEK